MTQLMMSLQFEEDGSIALNRVFDYSAFDQSDPWEGEALSKAKTFICERFNPQGDDGTTIRVGRGELEECLNEVFNTPV